MMRKASSAEERAALLAMVDVVRFRLEWAAKVLEHAEGVKPPVVATAEKTLSDLYKAAVPAFNESGWEILVRTRWLPRLPRLAALKPRLSVANVARHPCNHPKKVGVQGSPENRFLTW